MSEFTMQEYLKAQGSPELIQDSQVTRKIATALKARGFRQISRKVKDEKGKWLTIRVWSDEVDKRAAKAAELVAQMDEGLKKLGQ
jgi:hypothetical protein